ncbi:MAG: insulinase family protein [Chloroflexi bacterium]|nr:MAG: insulinase family protein [Chloroflexota bacterium]
MGGTTTNHTTRLYRRLVEGELATAVYGGITQTLDPYLGGYGATVRTGHTPEEVEAAIWAEIERVKQEPISEEEFAKALKQARAQFAYSSESVTSQARWLGFAEMMDSYEWFFTYLDRLTQVTAEDVRRVAQTYFDRRNLIVGWYVPEERGDDGR